MPLPAQPSLSTRGGGGRGFLGLCSLPLPGGWWQGLHLPPCFLSVASLMMASNVPDVTVPLKIERGGGVRGELEERQRFFSFFF